MKKKTRIAVIISVLIAVVIISQQPKDIPLPEHSRFQKWDKNGKPMHNWHGPWACVFDQQTGLLWENKTDDESIHDSYWSYSWYDEKNKKGKANFGDCYFEPNRCDTSDLIRRVNKQKTCGRDNWRLPTSEELRSIVFLQPKTGEATIANDFFSHTKRGDYWTADSDLPLTGVFAHLGHGARAVGFVEGKVRVIPYRNAAFVRLVSSD